MTVKRIAFNDAQELAARLRDLADGIEREAAGGPAARGAMVVVSYADGSYGAGWYASDASGLLGAVELSRQEFIWDPGEEG